jgi:hypothetical protein
VQPTLAHVLSAGHHRALARQEAQESRPEAESEGSKQPPPKLVEEVHLGVSFGPRHPARRLGKVSKTRLNCNQGAQLSPMANSRPVRGCFKLFQAVSTQCETAKTLKGIKNYPPVSLFRDFRGWATGNLNPRCRWFLAQFKLPCQFPQNRETAEQRLILAAQSNGYLFRTVLKQPETA